LDEEGMYIVLPSHTFHIALVQGFNYEQSIQKTFFKTWNVKEMRSHPCKYCTFQYLHLSCKCMTWWWPECSQLNIINSCMTNIVVHSYAKGNKLLCRTDIQQKSELHTSTFGSNQHSNSKHLKYHFKTQSVCNNVS